MKLDRFEKIKNYRIFCDYSWGATLPDFAKFNLLYGWNGSGKTTLSNLFRHLQDKSPISEGDVRFKIAGKIINGTEISSATIAKVRVFNRDTIDRNIFEVPNHELPPVYYVGRNSTDNQKKIEELKKTTKEKQEKRIKSEAEAVTAKRIFDDYCIDKAGNIKNLLTKSGGGAYNNYNKADFKREAESYLSFEKASCCLLEAEREKCLQAKDSFPMNNINEVGIILPDYFEQTRKVQDLLKTSVVSSVIKELSENAEVANWVYSGLQLHKNDHKSEQCHFCKNDINPSRIQELESHFSDEFSNFQRNLDTEINELEGYKSRIEKLVLPESSVFYPHLVDKYKKATSSWVTTKQSVILYLGSLINSLKKKKDTPFKSINLHDEIFVSSYTSNDKSWLMKTLGLVLDVAQNVSATMGVNALKNINEVIYEHNKYGDNFKEEVDKARKRLAIHEVSMNLEGYDELSKVIIEKDKELEGIDKSIEEITNNINILERESKEYTPAADELNAEMKSYLGRDEIKFEPKDNGYVITRNNKPAMHLSEGERTAITFMYFLKTLSEDGFDIKDSIVVIDDPISSLDANSMYSAFGFMKERTKEAKQLFILTHSFSFFRLVRGWFYNQPGQNKKDLSKQPSRFYMVEASIKDGKRAASIDDLDNLLKNYESEYHYLFKRVHEEANRQARPDSIEIYYGLPNIGRRLLEAFLTFKLPHYESGKLEKKLDEIKFDPAKKSRVLRFLHVHSHFDQVVPPEHDLSVLCETPEILGDLMDLIQAVDKEHFDGMKSRLLIGVEEQQSGLED